MNYILTDEPRVRTNLLPFTFTRPICEIRVGIMTIRAKWETELAAKTSVKTEKYLSKKYPITLSSSDDNVWINGSVLPMMVLAGEVKALAKKEALFAGETLIAVNSGKEELTEFEPAKVKEKYKIKQVNTTESILAIEHMWDIFSKNGDALKQDFIRVWKGKKNIKVSSTNTLLGNDIFIDEGAKLECAILNSKSGPIYVGKNVEIMEGAIIKGPVALCDGAVVKAGAKIYGPTTIGPYSKVGGEVSNSVIFGYSNKAHDGFLGNAVIGEWCNLGADTNNSNLKNNYSVVKMWSYAQDKEVPTGLTFCGLMMADHSKCGINTMFNTGTVVGVSANVFGGDFPKKFIPSFSWGGSLSITTYDLDKAFETAERMYERRGIKFDETEKSILAEIFSQTERERLTF